MLETKRGAFQVYLIVILQSGKIRGIKSMKYVYELCTVKSIRYAIYAAGEDAML